jgi:site-specific DNA recombinase
MRQEITGVFAEDEGALITERWRRSRLHRARQGQVWMSEAPYGYTYLPRTENCAGKLVINKAEAEVVRRNPVYTSTSCYNKRLHVPAKRRNMSSAAPPRKHNSSRVTRPREEWIAIEVPAIIEQETWEQARAQLKRNRERAPRNNKKHEYLLKGLLVCGCLPVADAWSRRRPRQTQAPVSVLTQGNAPCRSETMPQSDGAGRNH